LPRDLETRQGAIFAAGVLDDKGRNPLFRQTSPNQSPNSAQIDAIGLAPKSIQDGAIFNE
jgi:hypothetical protein